MSRDDPPRSFDPAARTLAIDLALQGDDDAIARATRSAMAAVPDDMREAGCPRSLMIVAMAVAVAVADGGGTAAAA